MKGLKELFVILPIVIIGVYASYKYVLWLMYGDTPLTIKDIYMDVSTAIAFIIGCVLYKIALNEKRS